ncbi:MAG: hypothetical protein WC428_02585 [Candidatus Paceibacterota bacterium]|jgi:hypothetical protein
MKKWEKIMDGTTAIYYMTKQANPLWYCKVFKSDGRWTFKFGQRASTLKEEKNVKGEKSERYYSTKSWKNPETAKTMAAETLRNHFIIT